MSRDASLEKSHLKQVWDILRSLFVLSFKAWNVEKCLHFYSQNLLRNFDLQNQECFALNIEQETENGKTSSACLWI